MRLNSSLAAALLAISAASVPLGGSAAFAKAGAPALKLSPDFQAASAPAVKAIAAKNPAAAKAALDASLPLAKSADDKYQYYALLTDYSTLVNDANLQAQSLAGLLETGLVNPAQQPLFKSIAARYLVSKGNTDLAIQYSNDAIAGGITTPDVYQALASAYFTKAGTGKIVGEPQRGYVSSGLKAFRQAIDAIKAKGGTVPAQWYQVGIDRSQAAGLPEMKDWIELAFAASPDGAGLRALVWGSLGTSMPAREEVDAMRLLRIGNGLLVPIDIALYAEDALKSGAFGDVKWVVEDAVKRGILKSSSQIPSYAQAVPLIPKDQATLPANEAKSLRDATATSAMLTGNQYLGYAMYDKAIAMYQAALSKPGVDANEANLRIGISYAFLGKYPEAKASISKVTTGSRSAIAKIWVRWLTAKGVQ